MSLPARASSRFALLALLASVSGCATLVKRLDDGSLRVQCESTLSTCMKQAENHCRKSGGVQVVSAHEKDELYGVDGNKEGHLIAEVVFYCHDDAPRKPIKLPPREATQPAPANSAPGTTTAPARPTHTPRVCVPGATQRCFGAGACEGGQACLADGSGFGPCECAAPAPSSSAAPAASASAAPNAASSR
jgi:hypothetical protein